MKNTNLLDVLQEHFGTAEAVRMNCEAGFEGIDVTMYNLNAPLLTGDAKAQIREMKSVADAYGVTFTQSHTPFPSYRFGDQYAAYNRDVHDGILRALEISGELGVPYAVVHPVYVPNGTEKDQIEFNLGLFEDFIKCAKDCGVKIAIENMWGVQRDCPSSIVPNVASLGTTLSNMVDAFRDPFITACIDVGHAGLVGTTADAMIREVGKKRLSCLHVHDVDFVRDLHTYPYVGKMNYSEMLKALREIGYTGDLTFEASNFYHDLPEELMLPALKYLAAIGEYMKKEIVG